MTFATYLLYLAAVLLLVVTPGPTMLMCMTRALHHGPRAALISVAGSPWLARSGPARWINRVCGGLFARMGTLLLFARRGA